MGGGSYSYINSRSRADSLSAKSLGIDSAVYAVYDASTKTALNSSRITTANTQHIFKQRSLDKDMDINGKIRESCDSEEHPESYPIIIGLDVTGSMANIPAKLVTDAFPEIMKTLMDKGVKHAQVCFCGIGDDVYDEAPFQVGQFETSDELTEKWLKKLYLEGGGGCNAFESYTLCWYFAKYHTKVDSLKRGRKGCLITIGDEEYPPVISKHSVESIFGDKIQDDLKASPLLKDTLVDWNVYHVDSMNYNRPHNWEDDLEGIKVHHVSRDIQDISSAIVECVLESYGMVSEINDEPSKENNEIIL